MAKSPATRKYFNASTKELEELFEKNKTNKKILNELKQELGHRKRTKAKELADRVEQALNGIVHATLPLGKHHDPDEPTNPAPISLPMKKHNTEEKNQPPTPPKPPTVEDDAQKLVEGLGHLKKYYGV